MGLGHALLFVKAHCFVEPDRAVDHSGNAPGRKAPSSIDVAATWAMWLLIMECTASPTRATFLEGEDQDFMGPVLVRG